MFHLYQLYEGVEAADLVQWVGGPFRVLSKRSIQKPNPHGKDIVLQESLDTGGTDEQQLHKISH